MKTKTKTHKCQNGVKAMLQKRKITTLSSKGSNYVKDNRFTEIDWPDTGGTSNMTTSLI